MKALVFEFSTPRMAMAKLLGVLSPRAYLGRFSGLQIQEVPEPELPADDWVVIRARYCGICGSDYKQLLPYILPLESAAYTKVMASWPGPVTWLVPCRPEVPQWLRGVHANIAVRVTDHPVARTVCDAFGGAIVSTSANPSGLPPARNSLTVHRYFGDQVDCYLHGEVNREAKPTEIRDVQSDRVVRVA